MAQTKNTRNARGRTHIRRKPSHNEGIIPQLALGVRELETAVKRGKANPASRTKFQTVALLMREERDRVRDENCDITPADRAETLKRLDGIAAILAKVAASDTSLIALLDPAAQVSAATQQMRRKMLANAGLLENDENQADTPEAGTGLTTGTAAEAGDRTDADAETGAAPKRQSEKAAERQVTPPRIATRVRTNPFLAPQLEAAKPPTPAVRLANWELIAPLLKSFEQGGSGKACMSLPAAPPRDKIAPAGTSLMPHQAELLAAVHAGHRKFLLADEPGLGKTAQSLLAASVAQAYPLLIVVPNVVKMNWAREAQKWTPKRRVTVIHGDGDDIDAFADIFVINYDILDRHSGWLREFGFKGMVVDEAHMIKNVNSQRSKAVLALAETLTERSPGSNPLLIALTGTPLINDIDDFRAIWRFLGWIDADKPRAELLAALEHTGLTPADSAFYPLARQSVIDLGIVRRRKIDVAKDLPAKSVRDIPVELDDAAADILAAERKLANKLYEQWLKLKNGKLGAKLTDKQLARSVCLQELDTDGTGTGMNVFTMVRQIGLAKTDLAVDYAAQLARSAGKVVFFAKHIEVMDRAERAFAECGLGVTAIRGNQGAAERQAAIDAFNNDPAISVIVCSLTAAGVGVNLQASSNVVLAELSWTDAEQTQAIDRVHRIGQAEPVVAWRIIAAQTVDQRIAELIDGKAGLAARALDGAAAAAEESDPVQLQVLIQVLMSEIARRESALI
ncbi:MAG: DEAD/DEAH box helicase [Microbacteriaceae bacterium]|nr:DEAD/DEAH box helicase [Microbacteriaceae bacterium]